MSSQPSSSSSSPRGGELPSRGEEDPSEPSELDDDDLEALALLLNSSDEEDEKESCPSKSPEDSKFLFLPTKGLLPLPPIRKLSQIRRGTPPK